MSATQAIPLEAIRVLLYEILEKCRQIELRASNFSCRRATVSLIQTHIIEGLVPQSRQYVEVLTRLLSSESQEGFDLNFWYSVYYDALRLCHKLIRETMDLFYLVESSTDGEDDDFDNLNSYYGEIYIRGNASPMCRAREEIKLRRLGNELAKILAPCFGPSANEANFSCGMSQTERALPEVVRILGPDLVTLAQSALGQFVPRYIHKYPDLPPYTWDSRVDPVCGSYSIVRKALSKITGEVVAIKTINKPSKNKERKLILRELGMLEICDHPNLIRLVDAYEADEKIHFVTTPWAPFTLLSFLQRDDAVRRTECPWFEPSKPHSDHIMLRIMFELSDGILYLHRRSIKHKDIKPDNILLHLESSRNVRPIITDFGVSKIYRKGGRTDYIQSTWTYLPFEQLDKAESSLKSDVWQLGCCFALILALACGGLTAVERLWDSFENTKDERSCNIAQELAHFMPVLAEVCSHQPQVLQVVRGMLEKEPAPRWEVEAVRVELDKLLENLDATGK